MQAPGVGLHPTEQVRVTERDPPVIKRGGVREPFGGSLENLNQGAWRCSAVSAGQLRAVGCHRPILSENRP
jgi:hypothetical protein